MPTDAALASLQAAIEALLADIDSLQRPAPPPVQTTRLEGAALRAHLDRLSRALEYDLGAVEPLLAELQAGVAGTPLEEPVASMAALVDVFEIDAAQERLRALSNHV